MKSGRVEPPSPPGTENGRKVFPEKTPLSEPCLHALEHGYCVRCGAGAGAVFRELPEPKQVRARRLQTAFDAGYVYLPRLPNLRDLGAGFPFREQDAFDPDDAVLLELEDVFHRDAGDR